eukprot:TRINITY_DN53257_c0_g1_i1.p1 TRINITY_DN53257_c0_g1~~TRINITY_DN53257_c0_g1_i1.p1  ORF type:complete len:503 (+),score=51.74 TRINITY_DN53257_c0_g1_i1:31-1539(+)
MSDDYAKGAKLDHGATSVVHKGTQISTGRTVAIKKIKIGATKYGINAAAVREITRLRELSHPNILQLIDAFIEKQNVHAIFEFMDNDMRWAVTALQNQTPDAKEAEIKQYMFQLLTGLQHLHAANLVHRDIKPDNLLLNWDDTNGVQLKIADFGLSKLWSPHSDVTFAPTEGTKPYKPPEIFLGLKKILNPSHLDMWAVGCVLVELLVGTQWFGANTDLHQLTKTFELLGSPDEDNWPGCQELPLWGPWQVEGKGIEAALRETGVSVSAECISLLEGLLKLDPLQRITATEALQHKWFSSSPQMLTPLQCHPVPTRHSVKDIPKMPEPVVPMRQYNEMFFDDGEEEYGKKSTPPTLPTPTAALFGSSSSNNSTGRGLPPDASPTEESPMKKLCFSPSPGACVSPDRSASSPLFGFKLHQLQQQGYPSPVSTTAKMFADGLNFKVEEAAVCSGQLGIGVPLGIGNNFRGWNSDTAATSPKRKLPRKNLFASLSQELQEATNQA